MKRLKNKLKRISREQLLALLAAVILAMASYLVSADQSFLKQGNKIERGEPGSVDKQYELRVKGVTDGTESLNVRVSPREFTEEEAQLIRNAEPDSILPEDLTGVITDVSDQEEETDTEDE